MTHHTIAPNDHAHEARRIARETLGGGYRLSEPIFCQSIHGDGWTFNARDSATTGGTQALLNRFSASISIHPDRKVRVRLVGGSDQTEPIRDFNRLCSALAQSFTVERIRS